MEDEEGLFFAVFLELDYYKSKKKRNRPKRRIGKIGRLYTRKRRPESAEASENYIIWPNKRRLKQIVLIMKFRQKRFRLRLIRDRHEFAESKCHEKQNKRESVFAWKRRHALISDLIF